MSASEFMLQALDLAREAESAGEVPVGAVVVRDGHVLGRGFNTSISSHDPTAHAEVNALRDAARRLGNYRLTGSTLYVTLEPCCMCAGAIVHSRIEHVVYAADDPRTGAVNSQFALLSGEVLNHRCSWESGLHGEASSTLLKAFFSRRR